MRVFTIGICVVLGLCLLVPTPSPRQDTLPAKSGDPFVDELNTVTVRWSVRLGQGLSYTEWRRGRACDMVEVYRDHGQPVPPVLRGIVEE